MGGGENFRNVRKNNFTWVEKSDTLLEFFDGTRRNGPWGGANSVGGHGGACGVDWVRT